MVQQTADLSEDETLSFDHQYAHLCIVANEKKSNSNVLIDFIDFMMYIYVQYMSPMIEIVTKPMTYEKA